MPTPFDMAQLGVILTIDILAIISNITLIFAILFRTPKTLQTFSIFLLNNAIVDLFSAVSSALGTVRVIEDHQELSSVLIFLGPCSIISEYLCRLCQGLHVNLVLQSTFILLLSFVYRIYILGEAIPRPPPSRVLVWLSCLMSYFLISPLIIVYYLMQTSISDEVRDRLQLDGYTVASFKLLGTLSIIVNTNAVIFSPVVMTIIFVVRRKLIMRIAQSRTIHKKQHTQIAKALTYQILLPCGVAAATVLWLLDVANIWGSESTERVIMMLYNIFSLASPLINLTMLPPYRALHPFASRNTQKRSGAVVPLDFTTMT